MSADERTPMAKQFCVCNPSAARAGPACGLGVYSMQYTCYPWHKSTYSKILYIFICFFYSLQLPLFMCFSEIDISNINIYVIKMPTANSNINILLSKPYTDSPAKTTNGIAYWYHL